jgi:hypothetical protein
MDLECEKCGFIFKRNIGYQYHVTNNVCDDKSFFCEHCGKGFTTSNSMYRHTKHTCKDKKEETALVSSDMKDFMKDYQNLKNKVTKMEKVIKHGTTTIFKDSTVNINNGTINDNRTLNVTNNTTNNQITIVAYGQEDMTRIDRDDIIKALKTGFKSTKHLTEVVHFNPKYPEYANIKRTNFNMKNKYEYHDGKNWTITINPHMIDDLYERKRDYIEESIDDYYDDLTKGDIARLQRWLDTNDDDRRIQTVKNEIRELLYNKKDVETNEESKEICDDGDETEGEAGDETEDIDSSDSFILINTQEKDDSKKPMKKRVAPRNGRKRKTVVRKKN